MRTDRRQSAMTLVEILVVLAVILIMVGALGGAGVYLRKQADIRMTEGTIGVLVMAIEQYYTDQTPNAFPFYTYNAARTGYGHEYATAELEADLNGSIVNPVQHPDSYASSEALYYFLNRNPNSAAIIGVLMDRVISNKDAAGGPLVIEIPTGGTAYDLIRFVDAWGMPIQYAYDPDDPADLTDPYDVFPILTSAGPDKIFGTPDDIRNK